MDPRRGLLGLGLFGARSSQFPTGVDRVLIRGKTWIAYDTSTGTLYRFTKKSSHTIARGIAPCAFDMTPNGVGILAGRPRAHRKSLRSRERRTMNREQGTHACFRFILHPSSFIVHRSPSLHYHRTVSRTTCAACRRPIDATARLCPYCGVDPLTGQQAGSQTIIPEARPPGGRARNVIELARQRQGIVIAITALAAFLILAAFHQFVTMRNATAVTDSPAVPLTEITELSERFGEPAPVPVPHLDFPYEGRPKAMRTFVVESGAIKPPDAQPAPAPAGPLR